MCPVGSNGKMLVANVGMESEGVALGWVIAMNTDLRSGCVLSRKHRNKW